MDTARVLGGCASQQPCLPAGELIIRGALQASGSLSTASPEGGAGVGLQLPMAPMEGTGQLPRALGHLVGIQVRATHERSDWRLDWTSGIEPRIGPWKGIGPSTQAGDLHLWQQRGFPGALRPPRLPLSPSPAPAPTWATVLASLALTLVSSFRRLPPQGLLPPPTLPGQGVSHYGTVAQTPPLNTQGSAE